MSQKRKASAEKYVVVTEQPRPLRIALAAFVAGAGLMWVVMRFFVAAPAGSPPRAAGAPDVSTLPTAQAAATLGNWEYDHANWAAAVQQYERAIVAGLDTPDVRTDLGTAYRYLGDSEKALENYGIAQRKDAFHQNSLFNQVIVHADLRRDPPRAIATAREFLRRFPQSRNAESAKKLIAELEAGRSDAEKKLGEFLTSPKPARGEMK